MCNGGSNAFESSINSFLMIFFDPDLKDLSFGPFFFVMILSISTIPQTQKQGVFVKPACCQE